MSSLPVALPVELWRPIIANVREKQSLASLAQVSRLFQLEAERILYRSLILTDHDDPLMLALSGPRRRALLVKECTIYLRPVATGTRLCKALPSSPSTHPLLAILNRLRNLESLSIRGPLPASAKSFSFPFRLRTFCTTEALSRPLIALLRSQPSISRLTLLNPGLASTPSLAGALPNAHALATLTPDPALAILPHRPVTHLHILAWAYASLADVAPRIGASSGPLRALMCAQGLELTSADMGLIAMHMPNLQFLGDVAFKEDISAYLPALSSLPLRTILINRASPGLSQKFSEPALVQSIGRACRELTRVVFTQRVTADYVWERVQAGTDEWCIVRVEDPCEVAANLWRAA